MYLLFTSSSKFDKLFFFSGHFYAISLLPYHWYFQKVLLFFKSLLHNSSFASLTRFNRLFSFSLQLHIILPGFIIKVFTKFLWSIAKFIHSKSTFPLNWSFCAFRKCIIEWVTFKLKFHILILIKFNFKSITNYFLSSKLLLKEMPTHYFIGIHVGHQTTFTMSCIHLENSWRKPREWFIVLLLH